MCKGQNVSLTELQQSEHTHGTTIHNKEQNTGSLQSLSLNSSLLPLSGQPLPNHSSFFFFIYRHMYKYI